MILSVSLPTSVSGKEEGGGSYKTVHTKLTMVSTIGRVNETLN